MSSRNLQFLDRFVREEPVIVISAESNTFLSARIYNVTNFPRNHTSIFIIAKRIEIRVSISWKWNASALFAREDAEIIAVAIVFPQQSFENLF